LENAVVTIRFAYKEDAAAIKKILGDAFVKYAHDSGIPEKEVLALRETEATILDAIEAQTYGRIGDKNIKQLGDKDRNVASKFVLYAEYNGEPAGTVRVEQLESDMSKAYVSRFGVEGSFREHGVGHAMIIEVCKLMRRQGVKILFLHTAAKNAETVSFYYKNKFYIESVSSDKGYLRALMVREI
jgi:ribosomal protein S18 acetylase RimI-like enzyme